MRSTSLGFRSALFLLPLVGLSCSHNDSEPAPPEPETIVYAMPGSVSAPSGKGSFRFGAASAATQIEDQNPHTDWYLWTQPKPLGLGKGKGFVGEASMGYSQAIDDVKLISDLHLDSYRFSVEWARIEPKKGEINEEALEHYGKFIDALIAQGIRPMITLHHFSNPVWVSDPRDPDCEQGPSDENLCGLDHPEGGALVVEAMGRFAKLIAERFGDRVDEWATLNEPVNYLLGGYGAGSQPPGKMRILNIDKFVPAIRNYIAAHVAMYRAIKEVDTVDVDGDGVAASVGFTKEAQEWIAARDGEPSNDPEDLAARDRILWAYQYLFVEALRQGGFDSNLDGTLDEAHPEWKDALDWLGVQYYFRGGVTGAAKLIPKLELTPCYGTFDFGSCIEPLDPSYRVPTMEYEHHPAGLFTVLEDFGARWPDLPLTVTESGIATEVGARRAEVIVRALEQIERARSKGVDVRGYYHWSIYDNFEWMLGYAPRFGLYRVDYETFVRTPTEGATVFGDIAKSRALSRDNRKQYGGDGPMTPELAVE